MLVLGALERLGGKGTKREVLQCIDREQYFNIEEGDQLPFATALQGAPRWELLVEEVFPRCVQGGCVVERDGLWELTAGGAELYRQTVIQFRNGSFDAHRCFLWTVEFKRVVVPDYEPEGSDRRRPQGLYHDIQWHIAGLGLPRSSSYRKRPRRRLSRGNDVTLTE